MSLLENLPHLCSIYRRTRTKAVGGDGVPLEMLTLVSSSVACFSQQMSSSEINTYQKQGMAVSRKVFFTENPNVTEGMVIVVTFMYDRTLAASERQVFDIVSQPDPDASAGFGVVWRVVCNATSSARFDETDYPGV